MSVAHSTLYPVMEITPTLQGEGFHQGKKAVFIRFAGCDVGCHWCDVKASWDAKPFQKKTAEDIVHALGNETGNIAVITGGEPLLYDCTAMTTLLHSKKIHCHVETSGTSPLTGAWDWVTFSPKKFKQPLDIYFENANELKIVIYHKSDFQWAESLAEKVHQNCHFFLQPEWSKSEEITPLIIDYIKAYPRWRLSLQIHKWLNIP